MNFYVYMLKSSDLKPITYVGYTNNLYKRIKQHNSGKGAKFTRGRYWQLAYTKGYESKNIALKEEYILKHNYKLRTKIKKLFLDK